MPTISAVMTLLACCCIAAAAMRPASAGAAAPEALGAEDVLQRMAEVYAGCRSYRDSGAVKTTFIRANGNRIVEKPFTTAFVRPDRFRFEYKEKKEDGEEYRYIVWREGKKVRTWWDIRPGVEMEQSLGLALAGATGVSGGSAHTVPALLLPKEVGGRLLTDLTKAKRIEDAKLGKVECYRVQGKYGTTRTTLWIDNDFLVRRIDAQTEFDDFRTEETTTYDPAINVEIPDKLLQFDPPERK